MTHLHAILASAAIMALSGFPSLFLPRRSRAAQIVATALMTAGGALGLSALLAFAIGGASTLSIALEWNLPWGGFTLGLDPLGAVFLALIFLVTPLGSIYGLEYWPAASRPRGFRALLVAYGLLAASMIVVVAARDGVLFLMGWEMMALSGFFAATSSDEGSKMRRAGWVYLIASHIGALCLFAMFSIWKAETGSFDLRYAGSLSSGAVASIFVVALFGFGFKAGFLPLHFWLPEAHANAPSHVSAVMSGVMLKMGIYGILRMAGLLPPLDSRLCLLVVGVGALSAVAGIVLATAQKDIKRVLAYSSVENLGIIGMGVGLGFLGRSIGRSDLALLGIGGALLHAWNHGLFKPLLFLGAGAVIRQTGTRDIETMGGLAKKTPLLAGFFILGSAAICALPPLNGFTSEFLLYVGFFRCLESGDAALTWDPKDIAAIAAAVLAMVGALAAACFVRLYSTVFSGEGRSEAGLRARENGTAMMVPMAAFGALCLAFGVAPAIALPAVGGAAASWLGAARETEALPGGGADAPIRALADLAPVSLAAGLGTVASAALAVAYVAYRVRRRASRLDAKSPRALGAKASAEPIPPTIGDGRSPPTWDCGYAAPTSRMQYTASSFGETIVTHFAGFLRPRKRRRVVDGPYPAGASFESQSPDAIIERAAPRARRFIARFLPRLRSLQTGLLQSYILYILAITIVLLLFGGPGALR